MNPRQAHVFTLVSQAAKVIAERCHRVGQSLVPTEGLTPLSINALANSPTAFQSKVANVGSAVSARGERENGSCTALRAAFLLPCAVSEP